MRNILLSVLIAVVACPTGVIAQSGGLQLLGIGPEAAALSLSEVNSARLSGGSAVFTNPANLAFETRASVVAGHTFWLQNSGNSHAAVSIPRGNGTYGLSVLTSSITDIEARQNPGEADGTFDVNYFAFAGAYAHRFGPVSVGFTAMYLFEQLAQASAPGYAINAGIAATFLGDRLRFGSSINNYGEMEILIESRSPLPTLWKSGVWSEIAQLSVSGSNEIPVVLAIGADVSVPLNDDGASDGARGQTEPWISTGLEITVSDLLQFRGGIRTGDTKRRFSTGVGIIHRNLQFNYAFVPFETGFGTTHALSMTFLID